MLWYTAFPAVFFLVVARQARSQFPSSPADVTVIHSQLQEGVSISLKENDICDTTPGVKSFSGYVHLPKRSSPDPILSQSYDSHTFWWFFESRKDPSNAPLAIWINGGPGSSSMIGVFQPSGPCTIKPNGDLGGPNPFSWNNEVNMLYIDQPVQTGFSYSTLFNGSVDYADRNGTITQLTRDSQKDAFEQNEALYEGTFAQDNPEDTVGTTGEAAQSFWHFLQVWLQLFPEHDFHDSKISLWSESYGGKYGPAFFAFFLEQNRKIAEGSWTEPGLSCSLHLDTLGIINGCIDAYVQEPLLPQMLSNNTYGIQITGESSASKATELYTDALKVVQNCHELATTSDCENTGQNETVNSACKHATNAILDVSDIMTQNALSPRRDAYDITAPTYNPFPPFYFATYLNRAETQLALGVPLNYTLNSGQTVFQNFLDTGDFSRPGQLASLATLLDSGIKVALLYGDADAVCNWYGGEGASLVIPHAERQAFAQAGYALLETNESYVGGLVRQQGNLSFSRVFNAGHQAAAFQPETVYRIFMRTVFGTDVATGETCLEDIGEGEYATQGPQSVFDVRNEVPAFWPERQCYVYNMISTCSEEQIEAVKNGSGLVRDFILVDENTVGLFEN